MTPSRVYNTIIPYFIRAGNAARRQKHQTDVSIASSPASLTKRASQIPRLTLYASSSSSSSSSSVKRSWGGELPDWDVEPYSSADEIDEEVNEALFGPDGDGGGFEFAFQNALAAILIGTLVLSFGNIVFKLVVVTFALVSAAFRYVAVGFLVLLIIAFFS